MESQLTVGVLSPLVGGFYFGGVISGINRATRAYGGSLVAVQTFDAGLEHTDYHEPQRTADRVAWDRVDGYVVLVDALTSDDLQALSQHKPLVVVSGGGGISCPTVAPDNAAGIAAAIDHLVWHGHTRIGFIGCPVQADMRERFAAYQSALERHGISAGGWNHEVEDSRQQGGRAGGQALLAAGVPTTALITATDGNALGVMQELRAAGLELPRDQAIIGFDDTEAAQHATPTR